MGIVLIPGGEIAHVVLKRALPDGGLEVFDPPHALERKEAAELGGERMATLVMLRDGGAVRRTPTRFSKNGAGLLLLVLGALAMGAGHYWPAIKAGRGRIAAGFAVAGLLGGVAGCSGSRPARPAVHMADTEYDAGALEVPIGGKEVAHVFVVENRGREPLLVRKASASCSCMGLEYPEVIGPGVHGKVRARLLLRRRDLDSKSYRIALETNDPARPVVGMSFRARALPAPYVEPEILDFGQVDAGGKGEAVLHVYCPSEKPAREPISKIECEPAGVLIARVLNQQRRMRTDRPGETLCMMSAEVGVEMDRGRAESSGEKSLTIHFSTGDSLKVPCAWGSGGGI